MTLKLSYDDDIRMLRDSAGGFFADAEPAKALRRHRDARDFGALARGLWDGMAGLGLTGTLVPEAFGGAGLGFRESVQVAEMMGRSLATGPFQSTAVMAATAIAHGDNDRFKAEILPAIVSGELVLAIAAEEQPRHQPLGDRDRRPTYRQWLSDLGPQDGGDRRQYRAEVHRRCARCRRARDAASSSARRRGADISVDSDHGRRQPAALRSRVSRRDSRGADDLICPPDQTAALLDRIYDAGRVHLAAEMIGLAQEAFDRTVDYLKTRVQFGRRIGEFQALQHRAAILFGEIEMAGSLLFKAATLHDEGDERFPAYASLAKARVGDIASHATAEACHLHGGIGMTDDFDLGFYLKRARGAAERLGDTAFHLERYAILHGI